MTLWHVEISISIDGKPVTVRVSTRWLDQVADIDDVHSEEDYIAIALSHEAEVRIAVMKKCGGFPSVAKVTLERADFPF